MTRINVIDPKSLTNKHLLAEYREITRIANYLTKAKNLIIPTNYTMGTGHVRFFYDKGLFLQKRTEALYLECQCRHFKVSYKAYNILAHKADYRKDYTPTEQDKQINIARINERLNKVKVALI